MEGWDIVERGSESSNHFLPRTSHSRNIATSLTESSEYSAAVTVSGDTQIVMPLSRSARNASSSVRSSPRW